MWGIDMIGEIRPTTSNGHHFILVAVDYFTKWVEAASFASVTKNIVAQFIRHNLICRYGIPKRIITDNGTNLNNTMITELCMQFKIKHHNSSLYRPKMNVAVEATNKNIKNTKDGCDLQRLARQVTVFSPRLSHFDTNINWGNPILSSIWYGSCSARRSLNPFSKDYGRSILRQR